MSLIGCYSQWCGIESERAEAAAPNLTLQLCQACTLFQHIVRGSARVAQVWHEAGLEEEEAPAQAQSLVSKWRQKERLKTTAVALVLCLNIGVDPPDVLMISPCARLECWVDPLSMQPPKALETIGAATQSLRRNCRLTPWPFAHRLRTRTRNAW